MTAPAPAFNAKAWMAANDPGGSSRRVGMDQLTTRLETLQLEHDALTALLLDEERADAAALREAGTQIPTLDGHVSTLQSRVDAVAVGDDHGLRAQRKALVQASAALSEQVQKLPAALSARVATVAERHRLAGNDHYRKRHYDAAIRCYTDAIAVDRRNPVYLCNRSACHQAKEQWRLAVADARAAAALDVNSPKAYSFQIKSLLRLGEAREAARVLQAAPLALRAENVGSLCAAAALCRGPAHDTSTTRA